MTEDSSLQDEQPSIGADEFDSISMLGVKVHRVDMAATLSAIRRWIAAGEARMIVTADASAVVIAQRDEEFKRIVNQADLVTPDGAGILLGSKWLGVPLDARVSGVDAAREICRMAAEEHFSVYFLGAAPGVAELAAQNMQSELAGLQVAGAHHGYFPPSEDAKIAAQIRASGAKALLVAMGIPRQEKLIHNYLNQMGVSVAIGVGGTFDVFSGRVSRAPGWMQRHGLEWAYRLAKNPRKASKVATLPRFVVMVLREKLFAGKRKG